MINICEFVRTFCIKRGYEGDVQRSTDGRSIYLIFTKPIDHTYTVVLNAGCFDRIVGYCEEYEHKVEFRDNYYKRQSYTFTGWNTGNKVGIIPHIPAIKNVIFNNPATIIFWNDNTKTVVKCGEYDEFDPEKGLAMAISKKALGNGGRYFEEFKKWMPEEEAIDIGEAFKTILEAMNNVFGSANSEKTMEE